MIAGLPMYQRPELAEAHSVFWELVRQRLQAGGIDNPPVALTLNIDEFELWRHPQLLLGQTCGMPYRLFLHDTVSLIGTPDYALEQCPPGYYRSAIVVRKGETRRSIGGFRDARFAFNQRVSQSGFAAAYTHMQSYGFWFARRIATGSHQSSVHAVAQHRADIASIDAVSWRLLSRYEPLAAQLQVLEWTRPTPGLPYICAPGFDAALIGKAVQRAISDLPQAARSALGITALVDIDRSEYLAVANPPDCA